MLIMLLRRGGRTRVACGLSTTNSAGEWTVWAGTYQSTSAFVDTDTIPQNPAISSPSFGTYTLYA